MLGLMLSPAVLKLGIAGMLVALGGYRLIRSRHIVYGGMQVNGRELATWSFLMATAHGAGLMVLPLVLGGLPPAAPVHHLAAGMIAGDALEWAGLSAAVIHTAGYLLVTGAVAVIVYEKVGVRFLRSAWINLDMIWAAALVVTGMATLIV
jgi:hypothetical protein